MRVNLRVRGVGVDRAYALEAEPSWTILDIVGRIRSSEQPDLLYRHSCHHGSCGTCGAMINGKPRLMCLTKPADLGTDAILIEPLAKMTKIEGIAVLPGPFFAALPDTDYLKPTEAALRSSEGAVRLEDCIECGICVAACPVEAPFLGPAALAAAEIEMKKHPARAGEMLEFAGRKDGAGACEHAFECSRVCPQGVAPGRRITELLKLSG